MKRYYYTYFDAIYMVKGLGLIESILRHESEEFEIFVICLDRFSQLVLERLSYPNLTTFNMADIEQEDRQLQAAKQNRSLVEYYWSIKAAIALHLIKKNPEIGSIFYLDADLYFYSSPNPLWDAIENQSVLLHEHRFSPEQGFLSKYGTYNAGMLGFRNDPEGLGILHWWRNHCLDWCHARLENDKFGDQLYLNLVPKEFSRVGICENIGVGVAPWNHIQYEFLFDENGFGTVNGTRIVFYHFHSLAFIEPEIIVPSKHVTNPMTEDILRICFLPYLNALSGIQKKIRVLYPDFKYGLSSNNILNKDHTFIAKRSQAERVLNSNVPQQKITMDETWDCYVSDQYRYNSSRSIKLRSDGRCWPRNSGEKKLKMLNLGCGTRYHPDWVNLNFKSTGPEVIAYDLYKGIPFETELFDVVYHSHLLEHFPNSFAPILLKECYRVLKPGGTLRVAVPDLEQIARFYIYLLEKSMQGDEVAQEQYEWIMVELFDQMVRNQSGGEMLEYWKQNPMPAEDFVFKRVGPKVKEAILESRKKASYYPKGDKINSKKTIGNNELDSNVHEFYKTGELHRWMYDRYSLSKLLTELGFTNMRKCHAGESDIPNFSSYLLDTEEDGRVRKPDSLFIEANRN